MKRLATQDMQFLLRMARETSSTPEGAEKIYKRYRDKHPATKLRAEDFLEKKPEGQAKAPEAPAVTKAPTPVTLFPHDSSLPEKAQQSVKDPGKLFEQAKAAHEEQLNLLNHGKGLDKALGAPVVRGDKGESPDYSKKGPVVVIGPMKRMERSKEKVEADYGGDWSRLADVVRASVAVDKYADLPEVVKHLEKSGIKLARQPKDRFQNPTAAGYRDILLNVQYPNGHVGELQLHVKPMLLAKDKAHKIYAEVRTVEGNAAKEGRTKLTEEEQKTVDDANREMKRIYDAAWDESGGEAAKPGKTAYEVPAGPKVLYYEYQGNPARWERLHLPTQTVKGKIKTIRNLEVFFREAHPISQREFEKMGGKV